MKISKLITIIVNKQTQYLVTFIQLREHGDNHVDKKYHLQKIFYDKLHQISSLTNRDYYNKYCKEYKLFNEINFNLFILSPQFLNSEIIETKFAKLKTRLYYIIKQWSCKLQTPKYLKFGDLFIPYQSVYQNPIIYTCGDLLLNTSYICTDCAVFRLLSNELTWYIHKLKLKDAQYMNFKFQNKDTQIIKPEQIYNILCSKQYPFDLSEKLNLDNLISLCKLNDIQYISKLIYCILINIEKPSALLYYLITLYKIIVSNDCSNINYIFRYRLIDYINILHKYITFQYSFDDVINILIIFQQKNNKNKKVYKDVEMMNIYNNLPFLIFKYLLKCKHMKNETKLVYYAYSQICEQLNYESNILLLINEFVGNALSNTNEYIIDVCDGNISHISLYDLYIKYWSQNVDI